MLLKVSAKVATAKAQGRFQVAGRYRSFHHDFEWSYGSGSVTVPRLGG